MTEEELRAALARPETYPGNPRGVQVRETHISWVFLAGERAYKLKKPVVLSFLDYGTPERRREMCRAEVCLNRRLAPEVYLAVRGIAPAGDGGVELVADDDPRAVDFLVEMLRYDERLTLAGMLARGELRAADVRAVGRTLASFHEACPAIHVEGGGARRVERALNRNLDELFEVAELAAERTQVRTLGRFLRGFIVAHRQELDRRADRGLVRDCHGDLRAEHILLGKRVQAVDCVEFDSSLRTLDVADDLAYLVMDLASLGGARFDGVLTGSYQAAGGDCGDPPLLSFFAVHRALVRAKVKLIQAGQHPAGSAAHGHASARARELLAAAERFSWRARLPLAIVICGVPASGKSHLASELARASGLMTIGSDSVRKELAGVPPTARAPASRYSDDFSAITYAELGRRAAEEVRSAGGVLVDATFRRRRDRDAFHEAFGAAAPLVFVECRAPRDLLTDRARRRERDLHRLSDADLMVVLRESGRWEPLEEVATAARIAVGTDRPVEQAREEILAMLDRRMARGEDHQ